MQSSQIIFYATPQGNVKVEVIFEDETFWLSQKRMAELFKFRITAADGKNYDTKFYMLDVIL